MKAIYYSLFCACASYRVLSDRFIRLCCNREHLLDVGLKSACIRQRCYEHKQYRNGLKFCKQILTNPKFAEHGGETQDFRPAKLQMGGNRAMIG